MQIAALLQVPPGVIELAMLVGEVAIMGVFVSLPVSSNLLPQAACGHCKACPAGCGCTSGHESSIYV